MDKLRRWLEPWVGDAAALVTLIVAWRTCADVNTPAGKFVLVLLSGLILLLIVVLTVQEYRYSRKARYAEMLRDLSSIYLDIQEMEADGSATADRLKEGCRNVVNRLSTILSVVTGTRCSACIKVIVQGKRPKVVTMCRDEDSRDRDRAKTPVDHWIDLNTDFEEVAKAAGTPRKSFFENRLPRKRDYKNTSFEIYGKPYEGAGWFAEYWRNLNWPLPYKSTIVLPIGHSPTQTGGAEQLAGFLCVDSRSAGVFSRRYDNEMTHGIAVSLYRVVHLYTDLVWREEEEK